MRILVKFPSRERPQKFMHALKAALDKAEDPTSLFWLFTFDLNDDSMRGIESELAALNINGEIQRRTSLSKIHACNRDLNEFTDPWDILLLMSDDMICETNFWDRIIRDDMAKHYPDGDGLLWYFDAKQADICTLAIMGRAFYNRFGYIYHPDYRSLFADDEQTAVARGLGKLTYSDQILFRHAHPANVSGMKTDRLYVRNESAFDVDHRTFKKRKAMNFGLHDAKAIDHKRA